MTIANKLETINSALSDIKTAIVAKGVTPSGDITTYSTAISNISGGSTINNQDKTVSAETSQKYVTFDSGYTGLGTVTINAVDSSIDNNIISGNIIEGKSILGVPGSAKAGANGYNFEIIGSNINITQEGIASGFQNSSCLRQFEIPTESVTSLEFVIKFTLPQSFSSLEDGKSSWICTGGFGTSYVSKENSVCTLRFGYFGYWTGLSVTVSGGETYWFKATWDGTDHLIYYSTDGINWTSAGSGRVDSNNPYSTKFVFGNAGGTSIVPFLGSIDLSKTYVKVNNSVYWSWKTMSYPIDIDIDGYYEVNPEYTGFNHVNVHVLDSATEMLQEINSGSGSVNFDESE